MLPTIDTLTMLGITDHPKMAEVLNWFERHTKGDGTCDVSVMAGAKFRNVRYWITLQYLVVRRRLGPTESLGKRYLK